jgi:hypothetical protein
VEIRFLNAPQSATAEDQLLVQFQGMIADYAEHGIMFTPRVGVGAIIALAFSSNR